MTDTADTVRTSALVAAAAGIVVLPATPDGSKTPRTQGWRGYQLTPPTDTELEEWFVNADQEGMGFICGEVSGGLEMTEFEDEATHAAFIAFAQESGLGDIVDRIRAGYEERTPGGGTHWFYRIPGHVRGNTKLASKPCPGAPTCTKHIAGKPHVLIETRGEGGWVVTAPSAGPTHESGLPYVLVSGGPSTIVELTEDERDELWALARTFDRMPVRAAAPERPQQPQEPSGGRPGDVYNARAAWGEVLEAHGWRFLFQHGDLSYWRRPGKQRGVSATTGRRNPADPSSDLLWVFTTSTEFEAEVGYSKWRAYAVLNHGGDHAAAASALRSLGYYTPRETPAATSSPPPAAPMGAYVDEETGQLLDESGAPVEEPSRSSWAPHDLARYLDPDAPGEPPPSVGFRDDGQALFYAGRTNALFGESGSMKSFIMVHVVAQTIAVGQNAAVIDFESTGDVWVSRLRAMGVGADELLEHFTYVRPADPLGELERSDVDLMLAAYRPAVVVLDGMTDAIGLHGFEMNSNKDVAAFDRLVLRYIADQGPALVTIDHVGRNPEGRNGHAIGAQHKRAAVTGVSYEVRAIAKFGRGRQGHAILRATKDRPGYIDGLGPGEVASFYFSANEDGTAIEVRVEAPEGASGAAGEWLPTVLMGRVSEYVEANPGASQRTIIDGVSGKQSSVVQAIQALVTYGFIRQETGSRNAKTHFSERPYREGDDLNNNVNNDRVPLSPERGPDTVSDRVPPPSPPRRGDGTRSPVRGRQSRASVSRDTVRPPNRPSAPNACVGCGGPVLPGHVRCDACVSEAFDREASGEVGE